MNQIEFPHSEPVSRPSFGARVRTWFFTGLIITGPLAVTIWLVWWFVDTVDNWVKPLMPPFLSPDPYLPFHIPGIGVLVAFIGYLASFFDPVQQLSQVYNTFLAGTAALDKIFDVMDDEPTLVDEPDAQPLPSVLRLLLRLLRFVPPVLLLRLLPVAVVLIVVAQFVIVVLIELLVLLLQLFLL